MAEQQQINWPGWAQLALFLISLITLITYPTTWFNLTLGLAIIVLLGERHAANLRKSKKKQ